MAKNPQDRTPLIVQAGQEDWDQFTEHLESVRANDNRTWTRDFYPEHQRDPHKPDPEIDRLLDGLLEPRQEKTMLPTTTEERAENHKEYAHEFKELTAEQLSREVYRLTLNANREDHEISDDDLRRLDAAEFEEERRGGLSGMSNADLDDEMIRLASTPKPPAQDFDRYDVLNEELQRRLSTSRLETPVNTPDKLLREQDHHEEHRLAPILAPGDERLEDVKAKADWARGQESYQWSERHNRAVDLRDLTSFIPVVAGITESRLAERVEEGHMRGFIHEKFSNDPRPAETLLTQPIQLHETLLERIEREAKERGEDLDRPQQRDLDRDLEHDL